MRLFLDTNVILYLPEEREPRYKSAATIATLADKGEIQLIVSALSYSTVFYILSIYESNEAVKEKIRKLKVIVETSDLTNKIIDKGLASKFTDFENALQYYCAVKLDCDILITRNGKDFKESDIPVLTPDEFINSLKVIKNVVSLLNLCSKSNYSIFCFFEENCSRFGHFNTFFVHGIAN